MAQGSFIWNELYTRDVDAAKTFYAVTCGWTYEGAPMAHLGRTYWLALADGKPAAGIMDMRGIVPEGEPEHWLGYIEVDDIDRCVAEIKARGGKIVREPFDIPRFGRSAIGSDAGGAFLAWVTPKR